MESNLNAAKLLSQRITEFCISSFWPLFICSIILIFAGMGLRDPWPADEPRFALIAKEMVETGQWFFPARAQELYPDKPPIFMWSIAFFYWLTGSLRISFLLPSALSGLLTLFLIYDIGKRLWSKQVGLIAGWILLFSFQFLLQSKTAQIDAMVCAWITLGCYGLLRYCLVDGKYTWYALAWFFMGIGVITKGVGFLPLLMLIPYALYRFQLKDKHNVVTYPIWSWYIGPLIMLAAIGIWFIPMLIIVGQSDNAMLELYRDNILFKQTITRYTDSWHHIKPAWYYVTSIIPVFWLPACLTIPWLIKPWSIAFKNLEPRIILPLAWVVLVILFFSVSPGKRGVYIFPALPMFALSIAPYFQLLAEKKLLRNGILGIAGLLSAFFIIFAILGLSNVPSVTRLAGKIELDPWYFFLTLGLLSSIGLVIIYKIQKCLAWPMLMSVFWLTYSTYGYVLRNDVSTPVAIFERAQQFMAADSELGLLAFSEQFILFSPYSTYHFGYHTGLKDQLSTAYQWQSSDNRFLLIEDELIDTECFNINKAIDLGFAHRRHWMLLPAGAKKASCQYPPSELPVYVFKHTSV